jgi:broad specificity phosphatase PhoE
MRRPLLVVAALLAGACTSALGNDAAAWDALRKDGAVALVRHGDAPGVGDPEGWKLDDCTTQRNLDDAGRAQARALGAKLKAERIPVRKVLASPWCRTMETAKLLGVGEVQGEPGFANAFVLSDRRAELAAAARAVIGGWRGPGALVVVTHGENIRALIGRTPGTAELVVVAIGGDGSVREVGAVRTAPGR